MRAGCDVDELDSDTDAVDLFADAIFEEMHDSKAGRDGTRRLEKPLARSRAQV
jgi:hypothetical protein